MRARSIGRPRRRKRWRFSIRLMATRFGNSFRLRSPGNRKKRTFRLHDASPDKLPMNIKLQGTIMSERLLSPKTRHASSGMSPSSLTGKSLLRAVQELGPAITARALEIEASRRIPADIVEVLKRTGIFRMFVPRSYGGLELDLPAGLEILVELAKIDSSVGWNAMTSSNGSLFAPFLPQQTYETIYQNGPDVIFAGATQPAGTVEEAGV